ncbi:MAG: SRPBCC family protein [Cyclobacteriaceae bacterium]
MKFLKILGIVIVALVVIVFVTIQLLPDEAHMSRSITIDAAPEAVYGELNSFRSFNEWSPWAAKDTAATYVYEGPIFGVGAKMSWASEKDDVGTGSMEIVEIEESKLVKNMMKFGGFDSSPSASFLIEGMDGGTKLTWTYDELGVSGINRIFGMMMDQFLGPDYEAGLQNFKQRMESAPKSNSQISLVNIDPFDYVGIKSTSGMEMISSKMAQNFGELMSYVGQNGIEMTGYPISVYTKWSEEEVGFTCGLPVGKVTSDLGENMIKETIQSGSTIKSVYKGDYMGLKSAHMEIDEFMKFAGYERAGAPWEEYVTDPTVETDTSQWTTHIYYPIN